MLSRSLIAGFAVLALSATPVGAQNTSVVQNAPSPPRDGTLTNCNASAGTCTRTACNTDTLGNINCNTVTLVPPTPPREPTKRELQQLACEARERERQWVEYCKPETYVDSAGVTRYRYAKPNCDTAVIQGPLSRTVPWLIQAEEKCRLEAAAGL